MLFKRSPIVLVKDLWIPDEVTQKIKDYTPKSNIGQFIKLLAEKHLPIELAAELIERFSKIVVIESSLSLVHIHGESGKKDDYGIVSTKVVTNAGVAFLVDAWQNIVELEIMKYHGLGTGGTAEGVGDTTLVTELTTQYIVNNTRATGSLTEASAPVFRTLGTNTVDASAAVTEHGIFSTDTSGAGVLWDRSLFSVINLANGDSLASTYDLTVSSGG